MPRKIRIQVDFSEDNNLFGISCHKKDYWLAFRLNAALRINLRRLDDFPFYQSRLDQLLEYPLYHDFVQDVQAGYFLISNFNRQSLLFPELRTTDFFILVQGRMGEQEKNDLLTGFRGINGVLAAFLPETRKLKEYDNFLSDLEIHMTSLKKRE